MPTYKISFLTAHVKILVCLFTAESHKKLDFRISFPLL